MKLSELAAQCAAAIMGNGDEEITYVEILHDNYRYMNCVRIVLEDGPSCRESCAVVIQDKRSRK